MGKNPKCKGIQGPGKASDYGKGASVGSDRGPNNFSLLVHRPTASRQVQTGFYVFLFWGCCSFLVEESSLWIYSIKSPSPSFDHTGSWTRWASLGAKGGAQALKFRVQDCGFRVWFGLLLSSAQKPPKYYVPKSLLSGISGF